MADKFIQSAIKHPGALTRKAAAAGMSIDEFARAHQHDGDETGRQARFYLGVLRPAAKKNAKSKSDSEGKADQASEPNGEPADEAPPKSEKEAAARFIARKKKQQ